MTTRPARMSDDAVAAATGRRWPDWFAALDDAGAADMRHADIARMVGDRFDVSGWWSQMVTVEYERERGLRDVHQTSSGYSVSVSRTLPAAAEALFAAWQDERRRDWLGAPVTVRKSTPNESLRLETAAATADLSVQFYAKGPDRCQVVVQQTKLPNPAAVESQRAFWQAALQRLGDAASP